MQWLRDMWTREGPGIPKDAPRKTGLALFAATIGREWWEMVKLNILFILASLPLVTIPAALVAMASVCVAYTEDRNTWLLRDFTGAFRQHFARATLLGVAMIVLPGICILAVASYWQAAKDNLIFTVPLAIGAAATVFLLVFACHIIVLMAMARMPVARMFRLAALASLMRPLPVLAALAFVACLWLAHVMFYPVSVFMPATINFSLGMFAVVFGAHKAVMRVLQLPDGTGKPETAHNI